MTDVKHSHMTRDIKPPEECHACALGLLRTVRVQRDEDMRVATQTVTVLAEEVTRLRPYADRLAAAQGVMEQYSGWWDGAPEDSWRLERDMRTALGMPPYDEDNEDYEEFPAIDRGPVLPHPDHPIQTPYDF